MPYGSEVRTDLRSRVQPQRTRVGGGEQFVLQQTRQIP